MMSEGYCTRFNSLPVLTGGPRSKWDANLFAGVRSVVGTAARRGKNAYQAICEVLDDKMMLGQIARLLDSWKRRAGSRSKQTHLRYTIANSVAHFSQFHRRMGSCAGVTGTRMLHFSGYHAQTQNHGPCPAGTDPAAAVRGDRLPRTRPSSAERVALLPHGNLGPICSVAPCWSVNGVVRLCYKKPFVR
jgi:hypothetical protein